MKLPLKKKLFYYYTEMNLVLVCFSTTFIVSESYCKDHTFCLTY